MASIAAIVKALKAAGFLDRRGEGYFSGAQIGASVGQYGHLYLYNPIGSNVIVKIDNIYAWAGGANGDVNLFQHNADLAGTDLGATPKNLSGPVTAVVFDSVLNAAQQGTPVYDDVSTINGQFLLDNSKSIEIPEGSGVGICGGNQNVILTSYFEWREIAS